MQDQQGRPTWSKTTTIEDSLQRIHQAIDAGLQKTSTATVSQLKTPFSQPNQTSEIGISNQKQSKESKKQISIQETIKKMAGDASIKPDSKATQQKDLFLQEKGYHKDEWDEVTFYQLPNCLCNALILKNRTTHNLLYLVIEPEYTLIETQTIQQTLEKLNSLHIPFAELDIKHIPRYLTSQIQKLLQPCTKKDGQYERIFYYFEKELFGLRMIHPLMHDPYIEEITCDGVGSPLQIDHTKYGALKTALTYPESDTLDRFILLLAQKAGRQISIAHPLLDATLPDGSRIHLCYSHQISRKGSSYTIRKKKTSPISPTELLEQNTMSAEVLAFLWLAVEHHINTLISGGSGSGKTTTLNNLALFIPQDLKIVSIETLEELQLTQSHWIAQITRQQGRQGVEEHRKAVTLDDLLQQALQQRPDYLFLGELLGKEAYALFQAMAIGHATYATIHAEDARSLIRRLETEPYNIPRIMLQGLDLVIQQCNTRINNKRVRRVKHIIELVDIDPTTKELLTNEVFRWDPLEDTFQFSGKSYVLEKIRAQRAIGREEVIQEVRRRAEVLRWIQHQNITDFTTIAAIIARYLNDPDSYLLSLQESTEETLTCKP